MRHVADVARPADRVSQRAPEVRFDRSTRSHGSNSAIGRTAPPDQQTITTPREPDVTHDLALVVADSSSSAGNPLCALTNGCVAILYGNGDGTFQAPVDITAGVDPNAVVVGDFNGDGRQDIAVAYQTDGVGENVAVLLNKGNDSQGHAMFAPAPGSPYPLVASSNGSIDGMMLANLTGHGEIDLVLSTSPSSEGGGMYGAADCVQVFTNTHDGTGALNPVVAYPADGEGQVAAADIRGTGVDDVLVPADTQDEMTGTGGFEVLHNDGTGVLDAPAVFTYPDSENARGLVVDDFNNDGKLDVAMADFTSSITVLFEGNGDGTFTYDDTIADPMQLQESDNALAAADFDGDCKPDLAAGTYDGGLVVMRNDTPPTGSVCPVPPLPPPPASTTTTTTTTTSTTSPPVVVAPSTPPTAEPQARVTQRIVVAGALMACAASALPLRIRIDLSPRPLGSRRVAYGAMAVKVVSVVKLDGHKIMVSHRRTFWLTVPLSRLAIGEHTLTFITTSSGSRIRGSRDARTVRFTRCRPAPLFTG